MDLLLSFLLVLSITSFTQAKTCLEPLPRTEVTVPVTPQHTTESDIDACNATTMTDDKAYDTESTSSGSGPEEGDVMELKNIIMNTKVQGGKSAWATTIETFGLSSPKSKKGDVVCDTFGEAMVVLHELMEDKNWDFSLTPFDDFDATKEHLIQAFVHWSRKTDGKKVTYNPSRALRRLESYVEWMEENCKGLDLRGSTMQELNDVWKMKITHDKHGRLVWWIDMGSIDLKQIKKIPSEDTLRYVVWVSHLIIFDKGSQENGFVSAQAMAGMMETFSSISMDLGTKVDRLTIGTLPIKMQSCILFNNPAWLRLMMGFMSPFLSRKMRNRIVSVPSRKDPQVYFEKELGKGFIPVGVTGLQGTIEKDLVEKTLERLTAERTPVLA